MVYFFQFTFVLCEFLRLMVGLVFKVMPVYRWLRSWTREKIQVVVILVGRGSVGVKVVAKS